MTAIIVEVSIPSKQVALSDTLTQFEDITFDVQEMIAHGDIVSPFVWVTGVEIAQLEAAFDADPSVDSYQQLTEKNDGSVLYEMEWAQNIDVIRPLIEDAGAVLHATGETDHWFFRLLFPTQEALSEVYEQLQQDRFTLDVIRIYQAEESEGGASLLTENQQETVIEAFERGYYAVPRETSLNEFADSMEISHQALSEQLRRAHRNLIETYVIGNGQDNWHDTK